jgi:hypothetical protein
MLLKKESFFPRLTFLEKAHPQAYFGGTKPPDARSRGIAIQIGRNLPEPVLRIRLIKDVAARCSARMPVTRDVSKWSGVCAGPLHA